LTAIKIKMEQLVTPNSRKNYNNY